ncbi:MAG TPA: malate synthase A, partial [Gemmatimonadaceae bacterium]|nr:malate synthase A [Gemmatimonadaceae bacterium]
MADAAVHQTTVTGDAGPAQQRVLTAEALDFVSALHRRFNPVREQLLRARVARQELLDGGIRPDFLAETAAVRRTEWRVAPAPDDLDDRRVEITGPVERKMMINALNSGAKVFMADFEDALSPTWANVIDGQANCIDAIRRTIDFTSAEGKCYTLGEKTATLVVRPRGWHLVEKHVLVDEVPISASLFDFGLYFFHNARELLARGSGPYFYLPKMESHREARLWNEVFLFAQETLRIPRGTIRATVLVETILAAFEMEEVLYELREHAAGLNAGRWDYLFSAIKKFGRTGPIFPDRAQLTMTVPFMRAYTELLVHTCHKRGAHAIGGMAAFIPSRRDAQVNETALAKVREDKLRESRDGFDGTWVAHPDLVPVATAVFDDVLRARPNQKGRLREEVRVSGAELADFAVPHGTTTEGGVRASIDVALQYIDAWLRGSGAVAIHNLMEDAATAEISRTQLWQWIRHGAAIDGAGEMTREYSQRVRAEELARLQAGADAVSRITDAAALL